MASMYTFIILYSVSAMPFLSFPFLASAALSDSNTSISQYSNSIFPNFTATHAEFIDYAGGFLSSPNNTFKASITNLNSSVFSFSVIHHPSNTIIWSATPNTPLSDSTALSLTVHGLTITDGDPPNNFIIWSTPAFNSRQVAALQLLETGNLILVDTQNVSLWETFDYPTDTLVIGQTLHIGNFLSTGDYRLTVTGDDMLLQWKGQTYWKLSMDTQAFKNSNTPVSFMAINNSGLYLFGDRGAEVVAVQLNNSDIKIVKLGSEGDFTINSLIGYNWVQQFVAPADRCQLPFICGKLGFCTIDETQTCICPTDFLGKDDGCVPKLDTISLPSACINASSNAKEVNSSTVYLKLQYGVDYFANLFSSPVKNGVNLSVCQDLCTQNCSCLGIFHGNSSGSCYHLEYNLGSIMPSSNSGGEEDPLGYIKALVTLSETENPTGNKKHRFPVSALVVMVTLSGLFLLITLVVILLRRRRAVDRVTLGRWNSSASAELEVAMIPGLPVRFKYEELVAATENFKTQIGSGGFGTVYKGIIQENNKIVAVKKMTSLGIKGRMEFSTEIAAIGSIHHVNLVKLRGFCIQSRQCFLVYDYMNRGSLEKILFGGIGNEDSAVLEWEKRYEIAVGMGRGLAYLHSGCQHKIIHCDIKPENILLHDDDFKVKISDFGLAKLVSHEKSKLLTTMRGTRGYLAPEWLTSYGITDKADVYSYGMVLLELVRGRRNCLLQSRDTKNKDSRGNGDFGSFASTNSELGMVYFPPLALEMHKQRKYMELADPRLEGRAKCEEVEKVVKIALCCIQVVPEMRPSMRNVVDMLEGRLSVWEPRLEALEFLRFYDRKFTEASRELTRMQ